MMFMTRSFGISLLRVPTLPPPPIRLNSPRQFSPQWIAQLEGWDTPEMQILPLVSHPKPCLDGGPTQHRGWPNCGNCPFATRFPNWWRTSYFIATFLLGFRLWLKIGWTYHILTQSIGRPSRTSNLGGFTLFMPTPVGRRRWPPPSSLSHGSFGMSTMLEFSKICALWF
jgi:hypothetical protein